jgi:predicted HicB family RNase H-like nuclease
MTQADTFTELEEMIQDAMRAWVETALEEGQDIPEPRPVDAYSGKFIVRVPRSLHRELITAAERDGVSLNAFALAALAKTVGASGQRDVVSPFKTSASGEKRTVQYKTGSRRVQPASQVAEDADSIT